MRKLKTSLQSISFQRNLVTDENNMQHIKEKLMVKMPTMNKKKYLKPAISLYNLRNILGHLKCIKHNCHVNHTFSSNVHMRIHNHDFRT